MSRLTALLTAALAASGGLLALGAGPASADPPGTISSNGPLTSITTTPTLNCAVDYAGDSAGEWYQDIACGTLVATSGLVFGPGAIPAGSSVVDTPQYRAYTPVSQAGPTGAGTASSPYVVTTVVDLGSTGLRLTQTDSYVVGRESYRTDVRLASTDGTSHEAVVYRAGDCYLQDDDYGLGAILNGTSPVCKAKPTSANPDRIVGFFPLSRNSHYLEGGYAEVWAAVATGGQLPDTDRGTSEIDNGVAISWAARPSASGSPTTLSSLTSFSPEGTTPVTLEAAADQPTSEPAAANGYTLTVVNAGATAQTLSSLAATLPAGFTYASGSTTGLTTADPTITGQRLAWDGSFEIPAATAAGPGTATLHFGVTTSSTPGRYTTSVTAEGEGVTVVPATGAAPIQVVVGGNRQPEVTVSQPAVVTEGRSRTVRATAKDLDGDPLTYAWTATPGAGVEEGASCTFADPSARKTRVVCDDDGSWNLALTVEDGRSGPVQQTTTLEVVNVAATLKASVLTPANERLTDRPITVGGTLADAGGNDTHTVEVFWGDDPEGTVVASDGGSFSASHTYTTPGRYTVVVEVTDDDGATIQRTVAVRVGQGSGPAT